MSDTSKGSKSWLAPPADYGLGPRCSPRLRRSSVYVATRDGTRLAVDVHVPEAASTDEPLPAILMFTPYYRRLKVVGEGVIYGGIGPSIAYGPLEFAPHGYAVVCVDVRGTGASFGARRGFRSPVERQDYHDIADWVVAQPWSNGVIGATGISYVGAAADFLASSRHPAVKAIIPSFAVWDTYTDMFYPGGVLCTTLPNAYGVITRALDCDLRELVNDHPYFASDAIAGPAPVDGDEDGSLLNEALTEHLANFEMGDFIRALECRDTSPFADPELTAKAISPGTFASDMPSDVAVYAVSGWHDGYGYSDAAVRRFHAAPAGRRHLLLGPWDHGAMTNVSPNRTSKEPAFELMNEYRRFFDHYLKGSDNGFDNEAPVHYFAVGAEEWRNDETFPPADRGQCRMYLADSGTLQDGPTPTGSVLDYQVDFQSSSGVDTRYEGIGLKRVDAYYASWSGRDERMLTFTSAPLADDKDIVGYVSLDVTLTSSARDGALFAYLSCVAPDGTAQYITEAVRRLSFPDVAYNSPGAPLPAQPLFTSTSRSLLQPGEAFSVRMAFLPTAWRVPAGHRIRLALAGADAEHFTRLPVGETPMLKIHCGGGRPSKLELPLAGASGLGDGCRDA